jgi:hypothetical protein
MAAYQYPSSNLTFAQTVTKVAGDNKLANPNSISPGQTITLPDGSSVVVQRGDTLSGIVDKWKTNAEAQANATPAQVVTPPATITEPPPPVSEPKKDDENAPITEPPVKPSIPVSSNTGTMKISPDSIRANPLSAYSSSTYNISLYMINPDSFNLYSAGGSKIPKDWKLICRSGGINNAGEIVFENDGTGNGTGNPRADGFELDYYIDDLRISTAISSKETYSACNSFDFSFKVYEPYGFSFPTKLIKAATQVQAASKIQRSVNESITALQTQYLLVIKFYGYDNEGKVISTDDYERSFPIQICGFDFKLDPKMVVYNIKAKLSSEGIALGKSILEIPEDMTVQGETVQDVLQGSDDNNKNSNAVGLIQRLNEIQQTRYDQEKLLVKDVFKIKFESNTGIDTAFLVDVENNPIEKTANTSVNNAGEVNVKLESQPAVIKKRTRPISINKDTSILQAIDQIITQSSYVTRALKISNTEEFTKVKPSDPESTTNTPDTIGWYVVIPSVKLLDFDKKRKVFASEVTYIVKRYEVPYIRGLELGKRSEYYGPVKRYKHWYMSNDLKKNIHEKEILSYDVNYNLLYFNLAGYGSDAPMDETNDPAPVVNLSGGSNPQGKAPGYFDKAISPFKTFLYSPADQIKAKIVILGDPDYLMTSTTKGYDEAITKWFGTDQSINPNSGQVFIEIDFRSAEDYAAPTGKNAGLLNPSQEGDILFWKYPDSIKQDVQGVIYMVWQVISTFSRGLFTQELKVCIPPFVEDKSDAEKQDTGETGRFNSASLNPLNGSSIATTIPSGFDTIATAAINPASAISPATFTDVQTSPGLQVSDLGPLRTTIPAEAPTETFNVANDDKMFAVNRPVDDGGRDVA